MRNPQSNLPPGFRFHPTDEELILHYLRKKAVSAPIPVSIIAEVDIYKFDPWDLPGQAVFGEKEWYFFSPRDRKYPNGARPNRAAASGYWKATGTDKTIVASLGGGGGGGGQKHLGVKKALVFYKGRPPKGVKTNWIMHEYRLMDNHRPVKFKDSSMRLDDWVLCRIYKKSKYVLPPTPDQETVAAAGDEQIQDQYQDQQVQIVDDRYNLQLHPMLKPSPGAENTLLVSHKSMSFSNLLDAMDYSLLSSFFSENPPNQTDHQTSPELQQQQQLIQSNNPGSNLFQKLPELNSSMSISSSPTDMENRLKRQGTIMGEDTASSYSYPSKKHLNSCSFIINSQQADADQCNLLNQSLQFNQQLLLSPHLSFH